MRAKATASGTAAELVPERLSYAKLKAAALGCTACPLYAGATQTVFGEGKTSARLLVVGQVPGDYEDRVGRPFVGPAGKLLDRCLIEAGIQRDEVYVTNAVKHFKWEPRGKRRLHKQPNAREIAACRPWLDAEIKLIEPQAVLCLGATAAQALLGKDFRVSREHGQWKSSPQHPRVLATVHPSSLLRMPSGRDEAIAQFIADLKLAARILKTAAREP